MTSLPATLEELIHTFDLQPLSLEGGWFRRRFPEAAPEAQSAKEVRHPCSLIDYAVSVDKPCLLHRITQLEIYSFLGGNPARLTQISSEGNLSQGDVSSYPENIQLVPGGTWQGLEALKTGTFDYSLVQITVIPEFNYEDREMAEREQFLSLYPNWAQLISRLT